ncbi:MAG: UDP-N-acetylmuramoyl-tripeptide--D-alanyl-D-alanine ligase [Candidatus Paceibacterota bacterium]|jgi:UDP-N-acetylmuramoyl-tripeptide--D-alanyl-D-alanine ligase
MIIRKYKPFVVAVTGSVGKTSTKDAIYCVLKDQSKFVRKSEKSMNSEIGLPLTIIGVANAWHNMAGWMKNIIAGLNLIIWKKDYPDCLILEIGADHPGDIKKVVKWLHPDIAVITKVSSTPVHVEFFKSPEQVFEEKAALATGVKNNGTLVLFADDEKVMSLANCLIGGVKNKVVTVVSYGLNFTATVKGLNDQIIYENGSIKGLSFNVATDSMTAPVFIRNVIGNVYMYPLLAAVAVGKARGVTLELMVKALSDFEAPHGRMNVISGINGSTIIDDTYNSSPDAVMSALETLKGLQCSGSKIAILGDMMELGKYSAEEHRKIGKEVGKIANQLITIGQRSRATAEEAVNNGLEALSIHSFDTSNEASDFARSIVKAGDIVLVKGSQSVRAEKVVKVLLKEPEKADKLLVRQEKEWLEKK